MILCCSAYGCRRISEVTQLVAGSPLQKITEALRRGMMDCTGLGAMQDASVPLCLRVLLCVVYFMAIPGLKSWPRVR